MLLWSLRGPWEAFGCGGCLGGLELGVLGGLKVEECVSGLEGLGVWRSATGLGQWPGEPKTGVEKT